MTKQPYLLARRQVAQLHAQRRTLEARYERVTEALVALGWSRDDLEARLGQVYDALRTAEGQMLMARARYEESPAARKNAAQRRRYAAKQSTPPPRPMLVLEPTDPISLYRLEKDRRRKRAGEAA